jgi:glycine dehydrogenase subunit 1
MHKYLPQTEADIKEMLEVIGAKRIEDLFHVIPKSILSNAHFDLPEAYDDMTLTKHMKSRASENQQLTIFRGMGSYDHYIPTPVRSITSRQEFLTSYTPYQPEVSQGTLQYIFEFQSIVCELTGMDVSNASMYDGSTSTAEAMFMAYGITGKHKICVSKTVTDTTLNVIKTYAKYRGIDVIEIKEKQGHIDLNDAKLNLEGSMGIIVQSPNKYGVIEQYDDLSLHTKKHQALFIMNREGQALSILKSPRSEGVDIACGDMQALGVEMSSGGASIGYLATNQAYLRKLPGRMCGLTKDIEGKRGFVLTLQAREQHIRGDKANSNICSNQSLNALAVTVYTTLMGKEGLKELSYTCLNKAYAFKEKLIQTGHFEDTFNHPHFKEFSLRYKSNPKTLNEALLKHGILGPHISGEYMTFAVTEKRTAEEMDALIKVVTSL